MRPVATFLAVSAFLFTACGLAPRAHATLVDGGRVFDLSAASRIPSEIIQSAGVSVAAGDKILNGGFEVPPDEPVADGRSIQLQVLRTHRILLNGEQRATTARTVAEVLREAGVSVGAADTVEPGIETPVTPGLTILHTPAETVELGIDGSRVTLKARAGDVLGALSDAGVPVIGLDAVWSAPGGGLAMARVSEAVSLVQEPVAFGVRGQDSPELELGLEQVIQAGLTGLKVTRTRLRYQDGTEILRQTESAAVVRPPQDRVVLRGTKIVEKATTLDGVSLTYWRALQMYATVYSPCNSGTADGSCSTGTASGRPAGKGVVAVDPGLFAVLNGQRLYIPGYGFAVIGDIGGGYIVEQQLGISRYKWIDLGFDDGNIQDMSGWITVYFLSPAPASIPDVLK